MQEHLQSEGGTGTIRTYVQGHRRFCSGQEAKPQQPPGHSVHSSLFDTFLDTWYLSGYASPSQRLGVFLAFSTLLATSALSLPGSPPGRLAPDTFLFTRHLPPGCLALSQRSPDSHPDHHTSSFLLDTLRSDRHPLGQWKLTVFLACGSAIKLAVDTNNQGRL